MNNNPLQVNLGFTPFSARGHICCIIIANGNNHRDVVNHLNRFFPNNIYNDRRTRRMALVDTSFTLPLSSSPIVVQISNENIANEIYDYLVANGMPTNEEYRRRLLGIANGQYLGQATVCEYI